MSRDEAIDIMAKGIILHLADLVTDYWELYPEIGEHDWDRIQSGCIKKLSVIAGTYCPDKGKQAYAALAARSE